MSLLSARARRLLMAITTEPISREEWVRAAGLRREPTRRIAELVIGGYVKKISTPEGNFFIRDQEGVDR